MRLLGKLRASAPQPAFGNVLTPGRIPEFCIPPRLPVPGAPESWPRAAALPRRCAAEPDLWPSGPDEGAGRTDWDPRSQAALSLPHLPRARTAYGFCALLESPHTRRKESLLLGGPGAAALPRAPAAPAAPRPRAHTCGGGDAPGRPPSGAPAAPAPAPRGPRLLRAPAGLLSRARRARRRLGLARARPVAGGDRDRDGDGDQAPPPPAARPPELLEAEGTVALGRAGGALRLAVQYSPAGGRLRLRLLRAEGPAGGSAEPRAAGCRVSFVLQPPGETRRPRGAVVLRSREAALDQDLCLDGLSEDEVRRLAVRVQAGRGGRGLERGELHLGALLRP